MWKTITSLTCWGVVIPLGFLKIPYWIKIFVIVWSILSSVAVAKNWETPLDRRFGVVGKKNITFLVLSLIFILATYVICFGLIGQIFVNSGIVFMHLVLLTVLLGLKPVFSNRDSLDKLVESVMPEKDLSFSEIVFSNPVKNYFRRRRIIRELRDGKDS